MLTSLTKGGVGVRQLLTIADKGEREGPDHPKYGWHNLCTVPISNLTRKAWHTEHPCDDLTPLRNPLIYYSGMFFLFISLHYLNDFMLIKWLRWGQNFVKWTIANEVILPSGGCSLCLRQKSRRPYLMGVYQEDNTFSLRTEVSRRKVCHQGGYLVYLHYIAHFSGPFITPSLSLEDTRPFF